jgi:hypothetical protein
VTESVPSRGKHLAILLVFIVFAVVTAVGIFYFKHARFPTTADLWGN